MRLKNVSGYTRQGLRRFLFVAFTQKVLFLYHSTHSPVGCFKTSVEGSEV